MEILKFFIKGTPIIFKFKEWSVLWYFGIRGHLEVLIRQKLENDSASAKSTLAFSFYPIFPKSMFLPTEINSKERYLGGILNFGPEKKLSACF